MTSWKALPFILVRRSKSFSVDRLSCSRLTSFHQFSHRSHNSQNSHKSMLEQCFDLSIRLFSSVTKDSIHISELFKKELLKDHSNREVTKLLTFILNDPKAMIDRNLALTLNLKVNFHHGKPYYLSSSQVPKHVFRSISKNPISNFGPDSESAQIIETFSDLIKDAKIHNPTKVLEDLYLDMPNNAWPCLLIGLYCAQDLTDLRAPSTIFNHLIEELA
mgnify:CR=1 FL=1